MFHLFRRYEKVIYFTITFVTILSFLFFGTYGTMAGPEVKDEPVFHAIDGSTVKRLELDKLTRFLSSDLFENMVSGSPIGANFLNDGVIRKDFIETGVAAQIVGTLGIQDTVSAKEKYFRPYRHPETSMISAEGIWGQFAPHLKGAFDYYKQGDFKTKEEAFQAKANLYLMESTFPAPMLRQVLSFQLQQQKWVKPDPALNYTDLSLFGYHTTRDWFGDAFVKKCAEVILNVARKAEREGYRVPLQAAEADLLHNGEVAFQQNRKLDAAKTVQDYVRQQLRVLGLDLGEASSLWRSVMLFRSYLKDHSTSVANEATLLRPFYEGEHEELVLKAHTLDPKLALGTFEDLQRMELYLAAVGEGESYPFPTAWKQAADVAQNIPELVLKHYRVDVKELSLKQVGAEIPLRDVWAFEESALGKEELIKTFPVLATTDQIDSETQKKIDAKARLLLVEKNPSLVENALIDAPSKEMHITLFKKGGKSPLKGIEVAALLKKLEGRETVFTLKGESVVYQVSPIEWPAEWAVASYTEAREAGQLDRLVDDRLTAFYEDVKEALFTQDNGNVSPYADVKRELAEAYFRNVLHQLKRIQPKYDSPDRLAGYRLYGYLEGEQYVAGEFAPVIKQEKVLKGQGGAFPYLDLVRMEQGVPSSLTVHEGLPVYVIVESKGTRDFSQTFSTSIARVNHQLETAVLQALFDDLLAEISAKAAYTKDV